MKRTINRNLVAVAVASALLGLAACETAPDSSAVLEQARSAVSQAESDPNVTKYAPTELDRARKLLINAEGAAKENGAKDTTAAHYAYLTTQMARIAQQRAQEQVATARVKSGEAERQKILLSARESEANQAIVHAQVAQADAQNAKAQATQAQAESQRLAAQLESLQASQTPRGIVLTLDDVLFDTGKAQLKSGARRSLDQIAAFLNENPERRVQVEGFTDSQGTNDFNLELSQSRADAVAMAIIQRGIDAQRVRALGYGEEFPVASNTNAGSRQLNRRVEIVVSNGDAAIPSRARRVAVNGDLPPGSDWTSARRVTPEGLADCALRLIGTAPAMQKVRELISRVAPTDSPVLICGESGCGKELVAESVHAMSPRADKPFVALNCAAIPAALIEAELFGHERGSFTGAMRTREGVFERANGGTLLLDEITEMPLDLQSRLLRVLETKRLNRVGGSADLPVDVRVIASANCSPAQAFEEGRLREDIYYRLAVVTIALPPLRERGDDILVLAEFFLGELNLRNGTRKRLVRRSARSASCNIAGRAMCANCATPLSARTSCVMASCR